MGMVLHPIQKNINTVKEIKTKKKNLILRIESL